MKVFLNTALALATVAMLCGQARAALSFYDPFTIDDGNPGSATTYVSGNLGGQDGGTGTFFTGPWVQPGGDTNTLVASSLSRQAQTPASIGGSVGDGDAGAGCCATARTGRNFAAPLQGMDGTVYMSFLVNFGLGNPADPHYRAVEFWNGGVGDGFLTMSLGISSFGNYDNAINQGADPNPNTQISLKTKGIRTLLGPVVDENVQLNEHMEWFSPEQFGKTHAVVLKFDLTTNDAEIGGPGDTISVFLDPKLTDVVEPTPSAVVSSIDMNMDRMSSIVLFHFTQTDPTNPGGFDELRVGTTWSDVAIRSVPEPSSVVLLGIALVGMAARGRRRT